ncbi:Polysaccharide biosynthesis protein [Maioricimonas rarisocia]|uniref:Polysaccharide biosynthesis protein n=1 Tax=Maioricimonas rarisocia TaxID=2528026 RepID=A0A517Z8M9_9PLAN|nr:oligosaccharide flippase family protein [Maioricimonas rarisocia]QDU38824.1 Polysaccharide biosynthesis protein [Maioricimonas rarisocia]
MSVRSVVRSTVAPYLTPSGRRAAWNLGWMLGGTGIGQLCSVASLLLLTRALGRETYGALSSVLSLRVYMLVIGAAGMRHIVLRETGQRPESHDAVLTGHLIITGIAGAVVALAIVIAANFVPISPDERGLWQIIAICNIASCMGVICFFDVAHRQAMSAIVVATVELAGLAGLVMLERNGYLTLTTAGLILGGKWVVANATMLGLYSAIVHPWRWTFVPATVREMWRSSRTLLISRLAGNVPTATGVPLVRLLHGDGAAGLMGLATQAMNAAMMLGAMANRVLQPHVAGPYGRRPEFLRRLGGFIILFYGGVALAGVVGSWAVIHFYLPDEFNPAWGPCCLLIVAGLVMSLARLLSTWLVIARREGHVARIEFWSAGLYLLIVPLLATWASFRGAAIGTAVASGLLIVLTLTAARSTAAGPEAESVSDNPVVGK